MNSNETVLITKGSYKIPLGLYKPKMCDEVSDVFCIITAIAKTYTGVPSDFFCDITILLENPKSIPRGVPKEVYPFSKLIHLHIFTNHPLAVRI